MICKTLVVLAAGLVLSSCGSDQEQLVKRFAYDIPENDVLSLEVEFNQDTELNTEFTVPILQYGSVGISPSNDNTGVILSANLNLKYIDNEDIIDLERTRRLPNGQRMSRYIEDDLARIRIKPHEKVHTSIYLGLNPENMYFGNSIELSFVDANFPAGLVISQRLRDHQNRQVGVVTFFGPHLTDDGQVSAPGGIFIATNVTDLVDYYGNKDDEALGTMSAYGELVIDLKPDNNTFVNDPYRNKFKGAYEWYKLKKLYKSQAKKAGLAN